MNTVDTQYVTFALGGQIYGVSVGDVVEVIRMVGMSESPEALPYVVGLINLRGHVVPVVDMRARLHLDSADYTLATPILITNVDDVSIGLIVDKVKEVIDVPTSAIEQPNSTFSKSQCVTGVAKANTKLIFLLNLSGIFSADDSQIIEELTAAHKFNHKALA